MTPTDARPSRGPLGPLFQWIDRTVFSLGREMRVEFLPPLMVYVAAGIAGLTGIAATFVVKEYLGLSAQFLAALGFWVGLPWALKMPVGHLVDLMWKWKGVLVFIGAGVIAASLLIMIGLVSSADAMKAVMPVETWYVLAALLAPVGYVIQDVVADAMTVEAVPRVDDDGKPVDEALRRSMHTTMQMLGRVAIIGGGVLVSVVNVVIFNDAAKLPEQEKAALYRLAYELALIIPFTSVAGVVLSLWLLRRRAAALRAKGFDASAVEKLLDVHGERPPVNWWILGGGLAFAGVSIAVGLSSLPYKEETIFVVSMAIIIFLMVKLVRELEPDARQVLIGTAVLVFIFRAMPGSGAGTTWWYIDELGFDQAFLSKLSLVASLLTLLGLFLFRRLMAEKSIAYIVVFLTIAGTILALPTIGMYYGLHQWTAAMTGGVVDARTIALVDTALESPLGQIAMVPMLAWIANSAPDRLKATFFAVMASFTNLALSASNLGTKYMNQIYTVSREVKDRATGAVKVAADYSELGDLLAVVIGIGFIVPLAAVLLLRLLRLRSA
jgi:MFS family permease